MELFSGIRNLDLLSVGVAIAAIGVLGFIVYSRDRESATNRAFLQFSLMTILYGTANYLNYQVQSPQLILWLLRLTIFFAVWHAFSFFRLFYVFPQKKARFLSWYQLGVVPVAIFTSVLTLTPFIFSRITTIAETGVTNPERGPGIALFGIVTFTFVLGGLYLLFKKALRGTDLERKQARTVLTGAVITFSLILTFNVFLPLVLNILRFIPLAPVFFLPFIMATSYAIVRYKLLDVKVIATEALTVILAVVTLFEIIVAQNAQTLIVRVITFALVLIFGILLIRSVLREVEQRVKLEKLSKELGAANEKLKELDKLKSQYLSFASHQVKAPMTAVKGFAQLIHDGTYGQASEKVREAALKIKNSADRMILLVNNILNVRKIEEGKMEYHFEPKSVSELLRNVVDELQSLAKSRQLELTLKAETTTDTANIDEQYFRQVLQNLIENALKYTEKGSVAVGLREEGNDLLISVTDSGRGMSAEMLSKLFKEYERDPNVIESITGTGLGLYIAKQIAQAHKGAVWAESKGEGLGSTFFVKLPKM